MPEIKFMKNPNGNNLNTVFGTSPINEELVDTITRVLEAGANLDFLLDLDTNSLKTLLACIRDRVGRIPN